MTLFLTVCGLVSPRSSFWLTMNLGCGVWLEQRVCPCSQLMFVTQVEVLCRMGVLCVCSGGGGGAGGPPPPGVAPFVVCCSSFLFLMKWYAALLLVRGKKQNCELIVVC
jgi:hypothetical protein